MSKSIKLGVIMDPIQTIHFKKDTTLAILLEAQKRDWPIAYFEQKDLFLQDGIAYGNSRQLQVFHDEAHWFNLGDYQKMPLAALDVILMRKDPPFNLEYIYTTHMLELAEQAGVRVINKPQSLRDFNEKLITAWFPDCCPKTLVTRDIRLLREFFEKQQDIVCKPLEAMGGASVFRLRTGDTNASVVFEILTQQGKQYVMAQQFIPEITEGDKRILIIDGDPIPFALARIPAPHDHRGNLAVGATAIAKELSARDRWICQQIRPFLRDKGLFFAGIDVIGDFLTEINITSPTCIRELDSLCHLNISATLLDAIEL